MGIIKKTGETTLDLMKNEAILDKTSNIISMLFPYVGLTKRALDMYISEVENSNMSRESKVIAVLNAKNTLKKLKNQKKIAEIAINTAETGTDFTEKSGVNQEWLERFMDSAGFVSDEVVQIMWGEILGQEFEKPGSTPLNMIRILSEITPKYAQVFRKICGMQVITVELNENGVIKSESRDIVVPYCSYEEKFCEWGLTLSILSELETLGLIKIDMLRGYALGMIPEKTVLLYVDGETLEIEEHKKDDKIPVGNVLLTEAGKCLKNITQIERVTGYSEMIKQYMYKEGIKLKQHQEYRVIREKDIIRCEKNL